MSGGIPCSICSVNYNSTDEIYSTNCGHIFHNHCLQEWQSRSQSCPQCGVENPQTHRVYLDIEETHELEQKIRELQTQLEESTVKISELQHQLDEESSKHEDTKQTLAELRSELDEAMQNTHNLLQQIEENNVKVSVLEEKCSQYAELKSQLEQSILNASDLQHQLEESERSFMALQIDYTTLDDSSQRVNHLREELDQTTLNSSNLQYQLEESERNYKELQEQYNRREEAEQTLLDLRSELEEFISNVNNMQQQLAQKEKQIVELQKQCKEYDHTTDSIATAEEAQVINNAEQDERSFSDLLQECNVYQEKIKTLESTVDYLTGQNRNQMQEIISRTTENKKLKEDFNRMLDESVASTAKKILNEEIQTLEDKLKRVSVPRTKNIAATVTTLMQENKSNESSLES